MFLDIHGSKYNMREIRKYCELSDNKNKSNQYLCNTSKMALKRKCIILNAYIKSKY